jgi:hypothetical protein
MFILDLLDMVDEKRRKRPQDRLLSPPLADFALLVAFGLLP